MLIKQHRFLFYSSYNVKGLLITCVLESFTDNRGLTIMHKIWTNHVFNKCFQIFPYTVSCFLLTYSYTLEGLLISCGFDFFTQTITNKIYNHVSFYVGFVFPVVVIIMCYVMIVRAVAAQVCVTSSSCVMSWLCVLSPLRYVLRHHHVLCHDCACCCRSGMCYVIVYYVMIVRAVAAQVCVTSLLRFFVTRHNHDK